MCSSKVSTGSACGAGQAAGFGGALCRRVSTTLNSDSGLLVITSGVSWDLVGNRKRHRFNGGIWCWKYGRVYFFFFFFADFDLILGILHPAPALMRYMEEVPEVDANKPLPEHLAMPVLLQLQRGRRPACPPAALV